jgi:penicillin-binding protein 1A
MTLFNWQGAQEAVVSPVDSIIHHLQFLNAGFLAMDPTNGQIKAWWVALITIFINTIM